MQVAKLTSFASPRTRCHCVALGSVSSFERPLSAEVKPRTSTVKALPHAASRSCLTLQTQGVASAHKRLDERVPARQGIDGWRGKGAATRPALLGAAQARGGLSGHAFADNRVVRTAREEPSRKAVPAGGDLWSDEDRRPGVGARSALRRLTRRSCLSAVSNANAASSTTRPLAENRSAVGAKRRPRKHEPSAGTAWRDAKALQIKARPRTATQAREQTSRPRRFMRCGSRETRWSS